MRVLLLDDVAKEKIAAVRKFSSENRYTLDALKKAHETFVRDGSGRVAVGNDPRHRCVIPMGFGCVYSEEEHPGGLMRHLSVSVAAPGKTPNVPALTLIMEAFGFRGAPLDKGVMTFLEELDSGCHAINVLEKMDAPA